MKTPIKPEDIRKGDLIREERVGSAASSFTALEYTAQEHWKYSNESDFTYYLLDRPEPPFEPHWGMMISNPENEEKAVYLPDHKNDEYPWASTPDGLYNDDFESDNWAKTKLAKGWVVIAPPQGEEGVK